jgi:exosortase/archaeosortase family protein
VATTLAACAPESFLNFWLDLTISSTKAIGFMLGIPVTSSGEIMAVNGFDMRIITQCTALHYVIILSTAILLYSKHSIQYRIAGVVISSFLVIVANALRLIITGVVGSISWDAFVITHDYLWVAAFSLLILGVWIAWADQRLYLTRETVKRGCMILLTCTAAYALLLTAMPLYGGFIATCASPLFKLLTNDQSARILFNGERMVYSYADKTLTANFMTDLMAVALYLGLTLSGGTYAKESIKRFIIGIVMILCISMAVIAGGGALMATSGKSAAVVLLWTAHGLVLELAVLWWMMRRGAGR